MTKNRLMILTLDGFDPGYYEESEEGELPHFRRIERDGFYRVVDGMVPTVTNVNNASILTGLFPDEHGIAANYWFDPETGEGGWIESDDDLKAPTYFDQVKKDDGRSLLISAKLKLNGMFGGSTDISVTAQDGSSPWTRNLPDPPPLTDPENSRWILESGRRIMEEEDLDFVYLTTTDYVTNHHEPGTPMARQHMKIIDDCLGQLLEVANGWEIYITANHGMSTRCRVLDLQTFLDQEDFDTDVILTIEDRYKENHPNEECGSAYIHTADKSTIAEIRTCLSDLDYVEHVFTREQDSDRFRLPPQQIGDLFVLANQDSAFGSLELMDSLEVFSPARSHGSLHERKVPMFGLNSALDPDEFSYSLDILRLRRLRLRRRTPESPYRNTEVAVST